MTSRIELTGEQLEAWLVLRRAWDRWCDSPTEENKHGYYGVAVPAWEKVKPA
jgi:hypothetical protein